MKPEYRKKLEDQGLKRPADAKVIFIPQIHKSQAGVPYTHYKEVIVKKTQ